MVRRKRRAVVFFLSALCIYFQKASGWSVTVSTSCITVHIAAHLYGINRRLSLKPLYIWPIAQCTHGVRTLDATNVEQMPLPVS